jgi:nucleoside 2-deoxyribosyltransferase
MRVYLASPLGFPEAGEDGQLLMAEIVDRLHELGHEVWNPWDQTFIVPEIEVAFAANDPRAIRALASWIADLNTEGLRECDAILAVVNDWRGLDPDSGTVEELTRADCWGLECYALRTDAHDAGDFPGVVINLQVERIITRRDRSIFRSVAEINF